MKKGIVLDGYDVSFEIVVVYGFKILERKLIISFENASFKVEHQLGRL